MTADILILDWLLRQLPPATAEWLVAQYRRLRAGATDREFDLAFGLVPRRVGKADLVLEAQDHADAQAVRPGWDPRRWSVDQAARLLLLLAVAPMDGAAFPVRLGALLATADLSEAIAILRGLPLYADPPSHLAVARWGMRSGMRPVFEAVAHANPYPSEVFDEAAWNQLVVKALFIESTLAPVQGLDRRANSALSRMLCDYAHERRAAGRPVSPELWRCVGPWADAAAREDLRHVQRTGSDAERRAATAALVAATPVPALPAPG